MAARFPVRELVDLDDAVAPHVGRTLWQRKIFDGNNAR